MSYPSWSALLFTHRAVDLFGTKLQRQNRKYLYLSGLPAPLDEPPPLPYPTTAAPATTPAPTCSPPVSFSPSAIGVRFGDLTESYQAYAVPADLKDFFKSAWVQQFMLSSSRSHIPLTRNALREHERHRFLHGILRHRFSLRITFRAVQPDGIMVYFASEAKANPYNWFVVYMYNGYIYISMKSSLVDANGLTRNLQSKFQYNNGQWWEVSIHHGCFPLMGSSTA